MLYFLDTNAKHPGTSLAITCGRTSIVCAAEMNEMVMEMIGIATDTIELPEFLTE